MQDNLEYFTDDSIALCESVRKRKEKRSNKEGSDVDSQPTRARKKKPAVETSDNERQKKECSQDTVREEKSIVERLELEAFKKFLSYCKYLEVDEVNEENLHYIEVFVSDMFKMTDKLSEENETLRKKQNDSEGLEGKLRKLEEVIQGATKSRNRLLMQIKLKHQQYPGLMLSRQTLHSTLWQYTRSKEVKLRAAKQTKATLMCNMAPVKGKLKIRGVRKISDNSILVETTSKEDMECILKNYIQQDL